VTGAAEEAWRGVGYGEDEARGLEALARGFAGESGGEVSGTVLR
jgi:hypothetical protein